MLILTVLPALFLCAASAEYITHFPGWCISGRPDGQPDYYWRNYYGVIPGDAVPGGYGPTGNVTYISQVPSKKYPGIFPGIINRGQRETVVCARERAVIEKDIKILCANPLERFEWVNTTADSSHLLTDYHWVVGGSTFYATFYVGRARFEGEVQIGRVFESTSPYKGLWLCRRAGNQVNFQSFELLVLPKNFN